MTGVRAWRREAVNGPTNAHGGSRRHPSRANGVPVAPRRTSRQRWWADDAAAAGRCSGWCRGATADHRAERRQELQRRLSQGLAAPWDATCVSRRHHARPLKRSGRGQRPLRGACTAARRRATHTAAGAWSGVAARRNCERR